MKSMKQFTVQATLAIITVTTSSSPIKILIINTNKTHQLSNSNTIPNTHNSKKSSRTLIMCGVVNLNKYKHKKYLPTMDSICRSFTVRSKLCKLNKPLLMMALIYKNFMAKKHKLKHLNQSLRTKGLIYKIFTEQKSHKSL